MVLLHQTCPAKTLQATMLPLLIAPAIFVPSLFPAPLLQGALVWEPGELDAEVKADCW